MKIEVHLSINDGEALKVGGIDTDGLDALDRERDPLTFLRLVLATLLLHLDSGDYEDRP